MQRVSSPVTKIWFLKRVKLFSDLTADELAGMDRITRMASVARRERIYSVGAAGDLVYLLKTGRVKVSRPLPDGRELILAILGPGEVFGEIEALADSVHDADAVALDDASICVIRADDFANLLAARPSLSIRLTKLVGLRFRRFENRVERLLFKDVPGRLADLLLDLGEEMGRPTQDGVEIRAGLTHQDLANLIASTRETVSLAMGTFRRHGAISFDRRSIRIHDRGALAAFRGDA